MVGKGEGGENLPFGDGSFGHILAYAAHIHDGEIHIGDIDTGGAEAVDLALRV